MGGDPFRTLRDFSDDPTMPLPWASLAPEFDVRVEVGESGQQEGVERVRVSQQRMLTY